MKVEKKIWGGDPDIKFEIQELWDNLSKGKFSPILIKEYEFYNRILKTLDEPIEHIKFYAHYEPLSEIAAEITNEQINSGKVLNANKIKMSTQHIIHKIHNCRKLIVFVGKFGLGHGSILKGHLSNLDPIKRKSIVIAFTGLNKFEAMRVEEEYGVTALPLLEQLKEIKAIYIYIAYLISYLNIKQENN